MLLCLSIPISFRGASVAGLEGKREKYQMNRKTVQCSCKAGDPFADLPSEARPRPRKKKSGLRETTCPSCGLVYWTNRDTDVCMDCQRPQHGRVT